MNNKKKTLIFIEDGSFTFDSRVIREATALIENGWVVIVVSPKLKNDPYYRKVDTNLYLYHYLKPNGRTFMGHIIEHTITLIMGWLYSLYIYFKHGFRIFHACNPTDTLWLLALPYKLFGVKFIYDQHDLCPELYLCRGKHSRKSIIYYILLLLERISYKIADVVISTNESFKEVAIKRGKKAPESIFVVRNGPDLKRFKKAENNIKSNINNDIIVGYLGNMNAHDGVENVILAANEIKNTYERIDIKFILIGTGDRQPSLIKMAKELGVEDVVTFTGRIPDKKMLPILTNCDICVQPDTDNPVNRLTTMNKVLEYMALEKPIVAFNLKETIVSCGDSALYADNIYSFIDNIIQLADNYELRIKLGKIGRDRIEKRFSWDYSKKPLLQAYDLCNLK